MSLTAPKIDVAQFVSEIVSKLTGVQLGERQQSMVRSRLYKHLSDIGVSESQYIDYYNAHTDSENETLLSLITTHHTYFFREYSHFEYLEKTALPALISEVKKRGDSTIRVWSAACSKGQEVYSLAMCIHHYLKHHAPEIKFEIIASDVDEKSVSIAKNGVYLRDEIKEIPMPYLDNHWAKGQGDISHFVKAKESLKKHCIFRTENLFDLSPAITSKQFDIIFCRNVFIYFDQNQIKEISNSLLKILEPKGYFFVGISESLRGLDLPLHSPGPSIYVHKEKTMPESRSSNIKTLHIVKNEKEKMIRVLCVDDSPSIISLLKKILTNEHNIEVVGVAINGIEAKEKITTLKPDVVTMDIHMPIQGGLEYLEENMFPGHPPVVMVSAVSRDDADLALKAIRLGATDYVEKPSIANMVKCSEEIRNKIKSAYQHKSDTNKNVSEIDQAFQKHTPSTLNFNNQLCLIIARAEDYKKLSYIIKKIEGPPLIVLLDGDEKSVTQFSHDFNLILIKNGQEALKQNTKYVGKFDNFKDLSLSFYREMHTSLLAFGVLTPERARIIQSFKNKILLLEDIDSESTATKYPELINKQSDFVPYTSFPYLSLEYFTKDNKK